MSCCEKTMEDSKIEITGRACELLNEAFQADPAAIQALLCSRVPCNQQLADHPHVIVEQAKPLAGTHFTLDTLGLLNGVLSAVGAPLVETRWRGNTEGPATLIGFGIRNPEQQCSPCPST